LRVDRYSGPSSATGVQPRLGISYQIKPTGTVLRASYARTMETPYNEDLLLSSVSGKGGLAGNVLGAFDAAPLKPGRRNQFNAGFQRAIGKHILVDGDYFWKFTDNAYDFGVLFDTPVAFPISWKKSKIDGVAARVATTNLKGFQAYMTMGHTRARFFGPNVGGLIYNSPVDASVFRIDHDQAFQQTTNLRYQRPTTGPGSTSTGATTAVTSPAPWPRSRTRSRSAAPGRPPSASTAAIVRQRPAGRSNRARALTARPDSASRPKVRRTRITIRLAPRHIFNASVGTDNLRRTEHARVTLRLSVLNLTNKSALYNFLSTFSGTHFVTPRSYHASIGLVF
jgi:hypothetical protein